MFRFGVPRQVSAPFKSHGTVRTGEWNGQRVNGLVSCQLSLQFKGFQANFATELSYL